MGPKLKLSGRITDILKPLQKTEFSKVDRIPS